MPVAALRPTTLIALLLASIGVSLAAQQKQQPAYTPQEQAIVAKIKTLRQLPDDVRATTTKQLALDIRALPASNEKLRVAVYLASRATEGDFGHDTLQEVTTTLADAVRTSPDTQASEVRQGALGELAALARYEHMQVALDSPEYKTALAKLAADDDSRQKANFTLTDLQGKTWTLKDLKGKVVLVNFWATWCPPCQKEMPDLDALYNQFKDRGFVILALSEDDETEKVAPFIGERKISYPILLDPGSAVGKQFQVEGIPKSFVYDRDGKLVTESIDMRTRKQFLEMLSQAGLE